ncbi:hypothetical protein J4219_04915 [Candidatus Woesearchaeota archaeon]|nr:hypothetical protein [Candidatus Woesearchaeota archaeon]
MRRQSLFLASIIITIVLATIVYAPPPSKCYETYMPGYQVYGLYPNIKTLWDSYLAQSEGVCRVDRPNQLDYEKCQFIYEISVPQGAHFYGGTVGWLCWYGPKEAPTPAPTPGKHVKNCENSETTCRFQSNTNQPGMLSDYEKLYLDGKYTNKNIILQDPEIYKIPQCQYYFLANGGTQCSPYIPYNYPEKNLCVCPPPDATAATEPIPAPTSPGAPPGCTPIDLNTLPGANNSVTRSTWQRYTSETVGHCLLPQAPTESESAQSPYPYKKGDPNDPGIPAPPLGLPDYLKTGTALCGDGRVDPEEQCETDAQCLPSGICSRCECYTPEQPAPTDWWTPQREPFPNAPPLLQYPNSISTPGIPCLTAPKPGFTYRIKPQQPLTIQELLNTHNAQTLTSDLKNHKIISQYETTCTGEELDFTFQAPDNYEDIKIITCSGTGCAYQDAEQSSELTCAGIPTQDHITQRLAEPILTVVQPVSAQRQITPEQKTISTGDYEISYSTTQPFNAQIKARATLQPLNPSATIIGTPIAVTLPPQDGPMRVTLPAPETEGIRHYAIVLVKPDGELIHMGGSKNGNKITVPIESTAGLAETEAVFAVVGLRCDACEQAKLEPAYDPGSRELVILIHGFVSNPTTWQALIDDFRLNKEPWTIMTFSYPLTLSVEENAQQLLSKLEEISPEFDTITLVAHSAGGIIAQSALTQAHEQNEPVLSKIKNNILLASPNEGTPVINTLSTFFNSLINNRTSYSLFGPQTRIVDAVMRGYSAPRVLEVNYYVVAGTRTYLFTDRLFTELNDGITTVRGAQHIGEDYLDDRCKNFFDINLTHTELTDHSIARKVVARIVTSDYAKSNPDTAVLGHDQYVRARFACAYGEIQKIAVLGLQVDPKQAFAPLNCNCGNGYCGIGEDEQNCPIDCASFISIQNLCFIILIGVFLLLLIGYGSWIISSRTQKRTALYTTITLTLILLIIQSQFCTKFKPIQNAQWTLLAFLVFLTIALELVHYLKRPKEIAPFTTQYPPLQSSPAPPLTQIPPQPKEFPPRIPPPIKP